MLETTARNAELNKPGHLHEAVVSSAQHGLRLLDRVNLARPRLTPHVEVLEEEVTRTMELRDVLTQGQQVTSRPLVVLRGLVEVTLEAGLLSRSCPRYVRKFSKSWTRLCNMFTTQYAINR